MTGAVPRGRGVPWVRYGLVGLVGVVLVLLLWSRIDAGRPSPASSSPASPAATSSDAVHVTADGDAYLAPTVKLRSSTLIVEQPVRARPAAGRVDVVRPTVQVSVAGAGAAARDDDGRASTRAGGGGLVAFVAAFDAETTHGPVAVGDEVTVHVTAADGVTYDVTGVVVADGRRYAH